MRERGSRDCIIGRGIEDNQREEREERRERETFTLFSLYAVSHSGRVRVRLELGST